jgi:hypothetical protein
MNIETITATTTDSVGAVSVTVYTSPFIMYVYIYSLLAICFLVMLIYKVFKEYK